MKGRWPRVKRFDAPPLSFGSLLTTSLALQTTRTSLVRAFRTLRAARITDLATINHIRKDYLLPKQATEYWNKKVLSPTNYLLTSLEIKVIDFSAGEMRKAWDNDHST